MVLETTQFPPENDFWTFSHSALPCGEQRASQRAQQNLKLNNFVATRALRARIARIARDERKIENRETIRASHRRYTANAAAETAFFRTEGLEQPSGHRPTDCTNRKRASVLLPSPFSGHTHRKPQGRQRWEDSAPLLTVGQCTSDPVNSEPADMIAATWNTRGYQLYKLPAIEEIMEEADVLCLTETWREVDEQEEWTVINCLNSNGARATGPSRGGVALVIHKHLPVKVRRLIRSKSHQAIVITVCGTPVMGCYISPQMPADAFSKFLDEANQLLRGPGVLIGDLNARDTAWDDTHNRRGPVLRQWAIAHNFTTQRPPGPTMQNKSGRSRVDLCFHRSRIPPSIRLYLPTQLSDHRVVIAELRNSDASEELRIPLALLNIMPLGEKIARRYERELPPIVKDLDEASNFYDLEVGSRALISKIVTPWTSFCPAKPHRFRPGWTRALDQKAKLRTALLRTRDPNDKLAAANLDRDIKREYKANVKALRRQLGDIISTGDTGHQCQVMMQALALNTKGTALTCTQVNPDAFTSFMRGLQPT